MSLMPTECCRRRSVVLRSGRNFRTLMLAGLHDSRLREKPVSRRIIQHEQRGCKVFAADTEMYCFLMTQKSS